MTRSSSRSGPTQTKAWQSKKKSEKSQFKSNRSPIIQWQLQSKKARVLNGLKFKFCRTIVRCRPVTTANYMISAYSIEAFTVNSSQSCTYSRIGIKEKRTAQLFHMHTRRPCFRIYTVQYCTECCTQGTVHAA